MDAQNNVRMAHHNRIAKIRTFINENWDVPKKRFEAYAYLFDSLLDDLRRDFLTDVAYFRNSLGRMVPVENELNVIRSAAMSVGLNKADVEPHLYRHLSLLEPRWLIDLPKWDGVDRVRTLCLGTEIENLSSECFYQYILEWGSGIFGRANDPSYQNKVLILRGAQGIGKDFFIKTLCKALGPYFGTWTNSRDEKEIVMLMERALVLNVPEFDNTHKNEIAMLKALITKYQATYRTPFARKAASVELRTSFISSANVEYLLRDSTGNRRYLIFVVKRFGLMDKFDEFDSPQIMAQFKHVYETKFKVSGEHSESMSNYIESQTPPPFEDQIIDFWNDEINSSKTLGLKASPEGWIAAREVGSILEKIRKEFGVGRNHVTLLLKNRGLRRRQADGIKYRAESKIKLVNEAF